MFSAFFLNFYSSQYMLRGFVFSFISKSRQLFLFAFVHKYYLLYVAQWFTSVLCPLIVVFANYNAINVFCVLLSLDDMGSYDHWLL